MRWPLSSPKVRTGLDIGNRSLKAVELSMTSDGWAVTAAVSLSRLAEGPMTDAEACRLRDVMCRHGFRGRELVVGVPVDTLLSATLELPPRSEAAPVGQLARAETARVHRIDPSAMEFDWWELPAAARAARGMQALSVALPHAPALALGETLAGVGLETCAMDGWVSATVRACRRQLAEAPLLTALLDVGYTGARIIVTIGVTPVYVRVVPEAGLGQLELELSKRLEGAPRGRPNETPGDRDESRRTDLSRRLLEMASDACPPWVGAARAAHQESVSQALQASAEYVIGQYPGSSLARVLLLGGGTRHPGLAPGVGRACGADAIVVSPRRLLPIDASCLSPLDDGLMALAVGLAQHPEAA